MKIFILGANGMLGKYLTKYFQQNSFDVVPITRKEFDIVKHVKKRKLIDKFGLKEGDIIINGAGVIKPRIKDVGIEETIYVNSLFPHELAKFCNKHGVKLIHVTTDCVYSGKSDHLYTENSIADAEDVYGKSKSLGEPETCMVIRTSIIGEEFGNNRSFVEWVKSSKDKTVNGFTNHYWNGITCLQYAKIVHQIISENIEWEGVRHIYSFDQVTKKEMVELVSNIYDLNVIVTPVEAPVRVNRCLGTNYYEVYNLLNIPPLKQQIEEMKEFGKNF